MNQKPELGARPAFLGPPQTFVLLQIDAALRADLLPDIYTILYITIILFFSKILDLVQKNMCLKYYL
jgi:hypothetical protein